MCTELRAESNETFSSRRASDVRCIDDEEPMLPSSLLIAR